MSKTFKGQHGFFILMLIAVIAVLWISTFMEGTMGNYSYQNYREDLANGNVTEVVIYQNEEAPTGKVSIKLKDESIRSFNVVNTQMAWEESMQYGISPNVQDISKPNWFLTSVLPYVLIFIVMFFMFNMMAGQSSGGSNSKMMNFGKSRAKMILNTDGKGTTFKEVAGVAEEKEE